MESGRLSNKLAVMMKPFGILMIWLALAALPSAAAEEMPPLQFKANEAESLLYLFNRTVVSGGDLELIAGLGAKLEAGLAAARQLEDARQTVAVPLNLEEIRYCLAVIARSTFEARYAGLVLGIKEKLAARLPPALPSGLAEDRP
jgi:hypothetical protein